MEIMLLDSLRLYFGRPRGAEEERDEKLSRDVVALSLSMLLSLHLQLNPVWPMNQRWMNKLTLSNISVKEPLVITAYGEINWSEIKGKAVISLAEEFAFKVAISDARRNRVTYNFTFGQGGNQRTIKNLAKRAV
jgi:hypothetical protein